MPNYIQKYLFIAGVLTPFNNITISQSLNNITSCQIILDYSPYIIHIPKYTHIAIFESTNNSEPTLAFEGVLVGSQLSKSILAGYQIVLSCFTEGIIWNARRQHTSYFEEMASVVEAGSTDIQAQSIGHALDNYYTSVVKNNGYDIGTAGASVLTSYFIYDTKSTNDNGDPNKVATSYSFIYNGKLFKSQLSKNVSETSSAILNPTYYQRFLSTLKLRNKMYGVSTNQSIKSFFNYQQFFDAITSNTYTDIHGENTFWSMAANTWMIGYHEVIDIPNPIFIPKDKNTNPTTVIDLSQFTNSNSDNNNADNTTIVSYNDSFNTINNLASNKNYSGLAQYIIKPRSLFGIPLKCNIIWPDQVSSFSILKDYLNEVTRTRWIRNSIVGYSDAQNAAFTTMVVVGPDFPSNTYFTSYSFKDHINLDESSFESTNPRSEDVFSDYEKQFGVVTSDLMLNEAYDTAIFRDTSTQQALHDATNKIRNFVNYEFSQKYFKSRACSIEVNNEVNVIPGLPIVILNETGQHIIAYCMSQNRSINSSGSASTQIEIGYPRYVSEIIGDIAQKVDPLSFENISSNSELATSFAELEKIVGSQRITINSNQTIEDAINDIYINYIKNKNNFDLVKQQYARTPCTYAEYTNFYLNIDPSYSGGVYQKPNRIDIYQDMDAKLQELFNSTKDMDNLSCNRYTVYDNITDTLVVHTGESANQIINLHKTFISNPANLV